MFPYLTTLAFPSRNVGGNEGQDSLIPKQTSSPDTSDLSSQTVMRCSDTSDALPWLLYNRYSLISINFVTARLWLIKRWSAREIWMRENVFIIWIWRFIYCSFDFSFKEFENPPTITVMMTHVWLCSPAETCSTFHSIVFLTLFISPFFKFFSSHSVCLSCKKRRFTVTNVYTTRYFPLEPECLLLVVFVFTGLPSCIGTFDLIWKLQDVRSNRVKSGMKFTVVPSLVTWTECKMYK